MFGAQVRQVYTSTRPEKQQQQQQTFTLRSPEEGQIVSNCQLTIKLCQPFHRIKRHRDHQ